MTALTGFGSNVRRVKMSSRRSSDPASVGLGAFSSFCSLDALLELKPTLDVDVFHVGTVRFEAFPEMICYLFFEGVRSIIIGSYESLVLWLPISSEFSDGLLGSRVKSSPPDRLRRLRLMDISDQLRCLFSMSVEKCDYSHVIKIQKQEVQIGNLQADQTYRLAVLDSPTSDDVGDTDANPKSTHAPHTPPGEESESNIPSKSMVSANRATALPELSVDSLSLYPIPNKVNALLSKSQLFRRMLLSRRLSNAPTDKSKILELGVSLPPS